MDQNKCFTRCKNPKDN